MSSIIPEVASALGICLSMMVFAGFYFSRKWHYATAILIGLFLLQFAFVFRAAQVQIENAFPTRGSGISGMRLTTTTVLSMKRLHQLQISPLPDCITVLWDGLILSGARGSSVIHARVRVVLNAQKDLWLLQRTKSKFEGKAVGVSTRDKIDSPCWETWYTAKPIASNGGCITPPIGGVGNNEPWKIHLSPSRYKLCKTFRLSRFSTA